MNIIAKIRNRLGGGGEREMGFGYVRKIPQKIHLQIMDRKLYNVFKKWLTAIITKDPDSRERCLVMRLLSTYTYCLLCRTWTVSSH